MTDLLVGAGYGRTVAFAGKSDALEAASAALPFWWQSSNAEPEHVEPLSGPGAVTLKMRTLERWVAEHSADLVFIHAAAVAYDNRAILLPGTSWCGKSTLCAELLRQGATYLSDEYVVLDREGWVHPYPRPIQLRHGYERAYTTAASLQAPTAIAPMRAAAVAILKYDEDAVWQVADLPAATGVLRVLANALCAQTRPEAALDAITAALAGCSVVEGRRPDASEAVAPIMALVQSTI